MELEDEARVTVDGVELTPQQSATLRVALASFLIELADDQFRLLLGPIGEAYRAHASAIQDLIVEDIRIRRENRRWICKACGHHYFSHADNGQKRMHCCARPGPSDRMCDCNEFVEGAAGVAPA